jgi:hypothetical protein
VAKFATTLRSTITTRGAYLGVDSKENPYSKQEAQQEKKLVSTGCKSVKEESANSPR